MKHAVLIATAATFVRLATPCPAGEPHVKLVPATTVYVVLDECADDVFRYGGYWYVFHDGRWFRARRYSGPFTAVDVRWVPRPVINLPGAYWRHPAAPPSGLARREETVEVREK